MLFLDWTTAAAVGIRILCEAENLELVHIRRDPVESLHLGVHVIGEEVGRRLLELEQNLKQRRRAIFKWAKAVFR